ncbi:transporter associated domain-containing protein [Chromatiaceae bacterium AAb-1]|nr:transporter associated domain-containing protein [Chromatiaceae bacterium AAb-1]
MIILVLLLAGFYAIRQLSLHRLKRYLKKTVLSVKNRQYPDISAFLDAENATVEDIMVPRNEIAGIDINDDWKDITRQLANSQHNLILLYRDNIDDAIGFVHPADVMRLLLKEQLSKTTLLRATSNIYFIPEGSPLSVQLPRLQYQREHAGLVVDEYGDIQGLVTLTDLLAELTGKYRPDTTENTKAEITAQPDGSYLIDGSVSLRELNRETRLAFPTDGPKTLNGLILEYLEEIPQGNLSLQLAGYPMEITEVQDNMVKTVRLLPVSPDKSV